MRRFILGVFVFGVLGTGSELLLLGHTEDPLQFVPLILLALSLVLVTLLVVTPGTAVLRLFRVIMMLFIISSAIGLYLHISANAEFEIEMYPSMQGVELLWESLRGALPALAPGTMAYLGLMGLAFTYRHPLLTSSSEEEIYS